MNSKIMILLLIFIINFKGQKEMTEPHQLKQKLEQKYLKPVKENKYKNLAIAGKYQNNIIGLSYSKFMNLEKNMWINDIDKK